MYALHTELGRALSEQILSSVPIYFSSLICSFSYGVTCKTAKRYKLLKLVTTTAFLTTETTYQQTQNNGTSKSIFPTSFWNSKSLDDSGQQQ